MTTKRRNGGDQRLVNEAKCWEHSADVRGRCVGDVGTGDRREPEPTGCGGTTGGSLADWTG
jgi:hypothetical protein